MKSASITGWYRSFLLLAIAALFQIAALQSSAQEAPGGPGALGSWSRPDKQGFLTTRDTPVWATIADGVVSEISYPGIDRSQTRDTKIAMLLFDGRTLVEDVDFTHLVTRVPGTLAFHVSSKGGDFFIEKDVVVNPKTSTVVIDYQISISPIAGKSLNGAGAPPRSNRPRPPKIEASPRVFLVHNAAADNTAGGDALEVVSLSAKRSALFGYQIDRRGDEPLAFARTSRHLITVQGVDTSQGLVGFEGVNDPIRQLKSHPKNLNAYTGAYYGNVAGALELPGLHENLRFRVIIAFDSTLESNKEGSLARLKTLVDQTSNQSTNELIAAQKSQWATYLAGLNDVGRAEEASVLVLRGLEDKENQGALVAAPSLPAIPVAANDTETNYENARLRLADGNGGYRRFWPRDGVQMGLGLLAAGDTKTPIRILDYLNKIQKADGTFPQNTWVDGTASWDAFQLDQTGWPIILVARLVHAQIIRYSDYRMLVDAAADALIAKGPFTDQERWEENGGLSPNTIAIGCQALQSAAWLEKRLDPKRSALYGATCETWKNDLEKWTFVTNGPLGGNYFLRIEGGKPSIDPNDSAKIFIHNQPPEGEHFLEKEIIDGGFLQWILSGLLEAQDPRITSTLQVYDRVAQVQTVNGIGFLRYNHDAYGMNHRGAAWPLLSAERALAALSRGEDYRPHLASFQKSVTTGGMIPEQVGISAAPLGWAHADALLLRRSLKDGKSFYINPWKD